MAPIRVIVTDDSALSRALLRDLLESDDEITVVGEAANGREAVDLVHRLRPDLVTMDLEMPVMGGLVAIGEIMATRAVPILVVSGAADAQKAYDAVSRGALEVIQKPEATAEAQAELVAKVKMLSRVRVITHLRARRAGSVPGPALAVARDDGVAGAGSGRAFAIASSTGGPQVLAGILSHLPACFPCPIVIAQHISEGFAGGLAEWLASLCHIDVRLARDGEALAPGVAYVAPSEVHLEVVPGRRLSLRPRAPTDIYRPSCDILLTSVAAVYGADACGIVLTGMGGDGASGAARIREARGVTLAQDEASSAIFGMNRVAIERGAIQRVLPAERIPDEMVWLAGRSGARGDGRS